MSVNLKEPRLRDLIHAFAVEIVGWQDPSGILKNASGESMVINPHNPEPHEAFYPEHVDNVLYHVQIWCDENETPCVMVYGKDDHGPDWAVNIDGIETTSGELFIALMDATVKAERERRQP